MRRVGDVLQPLFAQVDELGGHCAAYVPPRLGGDADPTWRSETFEARGNIDAVTVDVVRRDDHVAEIDADAKLGAAILRQHRVAREKVPLHFQRAAHRIDDAAELDESAIAAMLDDASAMLADLGRDNLAAMGQETAVGTLLTKLIQRLLGLAPIAIVSAAAARFRR